MKFYRFGFASSGSEFAQACPDCTASKTGFKAVATGNPDPHGGPDVWTIDQDKHLVEIAKP